MSSDNEEDSPELAALRARSSLAGLKAASGQAASRNREASKRVGSGTLVSLRHLSLRYPRFEEEARWQAKKVADEWKALGEQMMLHRKAAGLSLRQLAAMLKISPAFLSDMERGARHYTLRHAGPAMKLFEANNVLAESHENFRKP